MDTALVRRHFHRPNRLVTPEERFVAGVREIAYPCLECGETMPWRHG